MPNIAATVTSTLGEGPLWDVDTGRLLWLDIPSRVLHSLARDGEVTSTPLDHHVSVIGRRAGGLVTAGDFSVDLADPTGAVTSRLATLPENGTTGTNDGAVDRFGSFWVGTVDRSDDGRGAIHRVQADGTTTVVRTGVHLSNGIDWSPDGTAVYHSDSLTRRVDRATLDDTGTPLEWEPFVSVDAIPDGLTVDTDGCVWLALWNGGGIRRYTPEGALDRVVDVPGGFITSCTFGGPDLRTLYVTSANANLDPEIAARTPHAGALFAIDLPVGGFAPHTFG